MTSFMEAPKRILVGRKNLARAGGAKFNQPLAQFRVYQLSDWMFRVFYNSQHRWIDLQWSKHHVSDGARAPGREPEGVGHGEKGEEDLR